MSLVYEWRAWVSAGTAAALVTEVYAIESVSVAVEICAHAACIPPVPAITHEFSAIPAAISDSI